MNQTAHEPSEKADSRQSKRALQATIEYLSQLSVACVLTMWGFFNGILNLKTWLTQATDAEAMPWWITILFVAVTSLLPFAIGLGLFRRLHHRVNAGRGK